MLNDDLGTRMKQYESQTTDSYLMPQLPVYARLDGRAFHSFCSALDKPFDETFMKVMQETTKRLVKETNAVIGYTQSDEISLAWLDPTKAPFDGRLFKLTSVLASIATSAFTLFGLETNLKDRILTKTPVFDCRVLSMPNMSELANMFVWREIDASRNSINALAQSLFSHKELQGIGVKELNEKLFSEKGINYNDLEVCKRRGSYFKRLVVEVEPTDVPEQYRPTGLVKRTVVTRVSFPKLTTIENKVELLFGDVDV